ncbi:hypothetical protein PM082_014718 [Marasmius tenuissimus]|nr:hypothetical protein PM082_014718 [Marasmius tenuissimus]
MAELAMKAHKASNSRPVPLNVILCFNPPPKKPAKAVAALLPPITDLSQFLSDGDLELGSPPAPNQAVLAVFSHPVSHVASASDIFFKVKVNAALKAISRALLAVPATGGKSSLHCRSSVEGLLCSQSVQPTLVALLMSQEQSSMSQREVVEAHAPGSSSGEEDDENEQENSVELQLPFCSGKKHACAVTGSPSTCDSKEKLCPPLVRPLLSVDHLFWKAALMGPNVEFPILHRLLVDNGSHLVLIRHNLNHELGLPIFKLKDPEAITVATSSTPSTLSDFVKFKLSDAHGHWTSRTTHAVVCDTLCAPMILGLPFQVHNSLVVDPRLHSIVHRSSGFNLLNPSHVSPVPPVPQPSVAHHNAMFDAVREHRLFQQYCCDIRGSHAPMLVELRSILSMHQDAGLCPSELIPPINVVAAVQQKIKSIAIDQDL